MALVDALEFKVGLDMSAAERGLRAFERRVGSMGSAVRGVATAAVGVGIGIAGAFAAAAAGLKSVTDAGGQMEAFESRLTTLMGSSTDARARLGELFDYAASTPFEVGEIVAAETTLRGFGAAAEEILPGLIDFAATTGSDMSQAAIDFGKAWNQGATGLESDYGKLLRRQMELRAGMDATAMSIEQFRATMLDTLNEGMFAGGADRLSKTFTGMVSNLADEWTRFKLEVADAGVFQNVKGALSVTLDLIKDNREAIIAFAHSVSGGLWTAFKLTAVGVGVVVDQLRLAGAAIDVLKAAGAGWATTMLGSLTQITTGFQMLAAATGQDGLAGRLTVAVAKLSAMRAQAQEFGAEAVDSVGAFLTGESAAVSIAGWLAEAEASAASLGDELSDMGGTTPGGGQTVSDGKAKAGNDDLVQRFEAAQEFSAQMQALGLSDLAAEEALYSERMATLEEFYGQALITGEAYTDTREAIEAEHIRNLDKMRDEEAERDRQRQAARIGYTSDTLGAIASLTATASQALSEEQRDAALTMFYVSKAAALAEAGINAGLAISEASTVPPPANIPAMIAAGAIGAANVAAIAASPPPSFRGGTSMIGESAFVGDRVGAINADLHPKEAVITEQGVDRLGGRGVIDAANAGRTTGRGGPVNVIRFGPRAIHATMRDAVRLPGPLTRETQKGRIVGLRQRS